MVGCGAGLQTLRLGLSGVRSLALALPALTSLDINNTAELRCLELRCPMLLTAYAQACKCVPLVSCHMPSPLASCLPINKARSVACEDCVRRLLRAVQEVFRHPERPLQRARAYCQQKLLL